MNIWFPSEMTSIYKRQLWEPTKHHWKSELAQLKKDENVLHLHFYMEYDIQGPTRMVHS